MVNIALIDDELNVLRALQRALRGENYTISLFEDPGKALQALADQPVDLVISDYRMPQMNGVQFLDQFRQLQPDAVRLILSGQADLEGVMGAINRAEVFRFITKPWNNDELRIVISQALEFNRMRLENDRLANIVREQERQIKLQQGELERLERESPGITHVDWSDDGSIDLSGELEDDEDD